jgi:hypothetical protein
MSDHDDEQKRARLAAEEQLRRSVNLSPDDGPALGVFKRGMLSSLPEPDVGDHHWAGCHYSDEGGQEWDE